MFITYISKCVIELNTSSNHLFFLGDCWHPPLVSNFMNLDCQFVSGLATQQYTPSVVQLVGRVYKLVYCTHRIIRFTKNKVSPNLPNMAAPC